MSNFAASKNENSLTDKEKCKKEARAKFDSYDEEEWGKTYFDEETGGFLVIEKTRIKQAGKSDNEFKKFEKEQDMCVTLAKNEYTVEHLDDNYGCSYDIHINSVHADLKKTCSHNNIMNYAKYAVREQGAEMVVFEFENNTKKIHEELDKLKKSGIKSYYYFSNEKSNIHIL